MDSNNLNWSIDYYEANIALCDDVLKNMEKFDQIPLINDANIQNFKDGDLVRYVGMVQEILNPEIYYSTYSVESNSNVDATTVSGKYRDITMCERLEGMKLEEKVPGERLVFFCIPIPHMSKWVQDYLKKSNRAEGTANKPENRKRSAVDDETSDDGESNSNHLKFLKKTPSAPTPSENAQNELDAIDMYFPLHKRNGLPCIIKVYEEEEKCNILMNERIEVIGFLSIHPALECSWEGSDAEDRALHPPPSLIPRVHSIYTRKLTHNNPLLDYNIISSEIIATAEKVREDLHLVLTQVLFGDTLAADYVISYLLSRVYNRADQQALGNFSFNLCNIKSGTYARRLFDLIHSLVTNCEYIFLTIDSMNEKLFVPQKNYDINRLFSGKLQFCDDTHILVDETNMNEGQLDNTGSRNFMALENLVWNQLVYYDFFYYSNPYLANAPVLILSEGFTMLKTEIKLRLKPAPSTESTIDEAFDAAAFFLKGQVAESIRKYLTCMRLQEFDISEELMKKLSEDFVAMRQEDRSFGVNDFHALLVLSRLLALSYGRTSLTAQDWNRAVEMEKERKERLIPA